MEPHPLFRDFIKASLERGESQKGKVKKPKATDKSSKPKVKTGAKDVVPLQSLKEKTEG
jgi:hypothetical protein